MTNVALIGCGRIVMEGYVEAFRSIGDSFRVRVVVDLDPGRAQSVTEALSSRESQVLCTNDLSDRITQDVDLVLVALPPAAAVDVVSHFLARGKHVLAEKPLVTDTYTLDNLDRLARKHHAWLGIVTNYLHRPDLRAAIQIVQSGQIGDAQWVRLQATTDGHWRGVSEYEPDWRSHPSHLPAGVAADKGFHLLYLAEAMCGASIVDCQSDVARIRGKAIDAWTAQTRHANGAICSLQTSWAVHGRASDVLECHGSLGSVYLDPAMMAPVRVVLADGRTLAVDYPRDDNWGYRGTFLSVAGQLSAQSPSNLSGLRRWIQIIEACASANGPFFLRGLS